MKKTIFTYEGKKLWHEIQKRHFEGIMAKTSEGLYYPSKRKYEWLKIKITHTIDCVIVGYTSQKRAISSLALGLYDGKDLFYIGKVGTGFSERMLVFLKNRLMPLVIEKSNLRNIEVTKGIQWVKPHLVCEIKYQEFTSYGKMRLPVFIRLRDDKRPKECTFKAQGLKKSVFS